MRALDRPHDSYRAEYGQTFFLTGPNIRTGICLYLPLWMIWKTGFSQICVKKTLVMSSCSGNSSSGSLYPSASLRIRLIAGSTTATWRPARRRYRSRTASSASGSPSTTCSRPELLPTPFVLKWIDMHGFSTYRALLPCMWRNRKLPYDLCSIK